MGECDLFSLSDLRKTLNGVLGLRRPTLVDLSGITSLDLVSARELAVCAHLYAHRLILRNPSPQVTSSLEAFGLANWVRFYFDTDHEELPVFSGTPF